MEPRQRPHRGPTHQRRCTRYHTSCSTTRWQTASSCSWRHRSHTSTHAKVSEVNTHGLHIEMAPARVDDVSCSSRWSCRGWLTTGAGSQKRHAPRPAVPARGLVQGLQRQQVVVRRHGGCTQQSSGSGGESSDAGCGGQWRPCEGAAHTKTRQKNNHEPANRDNSAGRSAARGQAAHCTPTIHRGTDVQAVHDATSTMAAHHASSPGVGRTVDACEVWWLTHSSSW